MVPRYIDPSGNVPIETAADIAFIVVDAGELARQPSLENVIYLTWDVAAALLPYVPGSYVAKGGKVLIKAGNAREKAKAGEKLLKLTKEAKTASETSKGIKMNLQFFAAKGAGKSVSNMGEFFKSSFGKSIKNQVSKTSLQYDGQSIYKITGKSGNPYLKKGYGVYLDALHKDHLEVIDKTGAVKYVLNLDGTLNADKTAKAIGRNIKEGKIMNDIVSVFKGTLDYLKRMITENGLENVFDEKLNEQKENLVDLENLMIQYEKDISLFNSFGKIDSNETLENLIIIHTFITNFEWHLSEISELKDEIIKTCSSKRK